MKDAESERSGQSHVASQPAFFPPFRDPCGMLSRSVGMLSRSDKPPYIWTRVVYRGNVFANPTAPSSAPYPQESNPWVSNVSEHTSPHVMSVSQTPALDQRCQSGPSARNSSSRQNERNSSRTRSPRGRSPSGRMFRWPCKDYLKGTCTNSFCEKWHPPECLFYEAENGCRFGKRAPMRTARLMNSLAKGPKRMVTKVQWLC